MKIIERVGDVIRFLNCGEQMFRTNDGNWQVTHGLGLVPARVAAEIRNVPGVYQSYSNTNDCYGARPTIDVEATREARRMASTVNGAILYVPPHQAAEAPKTTREGEG